MRSCYDAGSSSRPFQHHQVVLQIHENPSKNLNFHKNKSLIIDIAQTTSIFSEFIESLSIVSRFSGVEYLEYRVFTYSRHYHSSSTEPCDEENIRGLRTFVGPGTIGRTQLCSVFGSFNCCTG